MEEGLMFLIKIFFIFAVVLFFFVSAGLGRVVGSDINEIRKIMVVK
jgi:hypothetical protein